MKIIYVHCGEETNIRDPRSYEHYWISSWNKTWKKIQARTGFEPKTFATPVQRTTNWANHRQPKLQLWDDHLAQ